MSALRLLIVEDNEKELTSCRDTIDRYKDETGRKVDLVECKNVEEALKTLDNSFDGAIIDLKLGNQGDEGNQVIHKIEEFQFRIPVFILTGTPDPVNPNSTYIELFKKGNSGSGYGDLLDRFWDIYNTGLTRIMGGRGIIEETLNNVFQQNLIEQKDIWIEYGKVDSYRTEKALLRYTLNHLLQLLDYDEDSCFPEEVYLFPPRTEQPWTGSIVKEEKIGKRFTVMSPACDLVPRKNGTFKTDRILLVAIEKEPDVIESALHGIKNATKKKSKLKDVLGNNYTDYYHWLPKTNFFEGGFLNFRKLSSLEIEQFQKKFSMPPETQISPSFVKDIVARFSSYYARQGQPDIDSDKFMN